jgi:hypothetical protein
MAFFFYFKSNRTLVRRSNALHFNNSGSHVITADKFGDIYK